VSRGATARLFVAVDPPAPVRGPLAGWARTAAAGLRSAGIGRPLRLLDPAGLHLTLCFLGSRPVEEIAAISSTLSACATYAGELSLGAPLWLPSSRPRSLAVAVHDELGGLARLHAAVSEAVRDATAWEPERRRFRAHITVARRSGRVERRVRARGPVAGLELPATPALRFAAESVTLYRSWLSPQGASYEVISRCALEPSVP
jgi:RNA 2',3'-cyclic 3'-phosphodiesterase